MWKITILRQKNHIFTNFRGGGAPGAPPPPESAPAVNPNLATEHLQTFQPNKAIEF